MKQLLFLTGLLLSANSLVAQVQRNFIYQDSTYLIKIDTPRNGQTSFHLCNQRNICQRSAILLWPFEKSVFTSEFNRLIDSLDRRTMSGTTNARRGLTDLFSEWYIHQFPPVTQSPVASATAGISASAGKTSIPVPIGKLFIKSDSIVVNGVKAGVKEIRVTIENGVIARKALFITTSNGTVYFNRRAPIGFPRFSKRRFDNLNAWQGPDSATIKIDDALGYIPFGKIFYPEDKEIILDPVLHRTDTLTVNSNLNNIIEVAVYTDLLGVLGDKPNGLIQTEVAGNFISNTGNIKNSTFTFHHFVRPYLRLSKFDSKFRSVDSSRISKGTGGDTLDRTYITQITYLQAGLRMNIVKIGLGINQSFLINTGADVNLVNADSVYKKDLTYFNYYAELNYAITRLKNFGMEASLRWLWQYLSSANTTNIQINNTRHESFFNPNFNIYYFPNNDPGSKIYFRFAYMSNKKHGTSNYSQFQVGYRTNLKL